MNSIVSDVRAAGVEPILVVAPTVDPRENFRDLPAGVAVWRYHDPSEYPSLYDPVNRYDTAHLNDAGARIFTDLLAERLAELLQGRR